MKEGLERLKRESEKQTEESAASPSSQSDEVKVKVNVEVKLEIEETESKRPREHLDSIRSEGTVKSDHSRNTDIEIKIDVAEPVSKGRKKKRKKRKNAGQNAQQVKVDTSVEAASVNPDKNKNNDEIFDMEDLSTDDELSRLTSTMTNGSMSKSISLPVVEENRLARTNEWASAHEGFSYLISHPFSDTDLSPLAR